MFVALNSAFAGQLRKSAELVAKEPSLRSCGRKSSEARYIGYYEGWNTQRQCDTVTPDNILNAVGACSEATMVSLSGDFTQ
ncbi:unnamed protein product [Penicillium roqueforti FM164]|uniref:Genomic scaffold, ProqFM164S02 n=1 Tax=Penicillium roqueforti (strain FM164) TaxID=1365484 RepID=W6QK27_PENRF|nr:unnamed protein product [Penicillium roqueforti FM164]